MTSFVETAQTSMGPVALAQMWLSWLKIESDCSNIDSGVVRMRYAIISISTHSIQFQPMNDVGTWQQRRMHCKQLSDNEISLKWMTQFRSIEREEDEEKNTTNRIECPGLQIIHFHYNGYYFCLLFHWFYVFICAIQSNAIRFVIVDIIYIIILGSMRPQKLTKI